MDQRIGINIALLFSIILLSTILFHSTKETEQPEPLPLSAIDSGTITQIEIIRQDLDHFLFTKEGNKWFMRSPLQYEANSARIDPLLQILKTESHSRLAVADVELKRFELADPSITMKLNHHIFQFGNTESIDQRRYVLFNDQLHLTDDFLYPLLTANAAFYANPKLLPMGSKIISITFPDNQISLVDDQWQIKPPLDIKPEKLKQIVSHWQNATASSVNKYRAPETESLITVSTSDHETIEFIIVSIEPLILGRKDIGVQYHFYRREADKLFLNLSSDDPSVLPEISEPE